MMYSDLASRLRSNPDEPWLTPIREFVVEGLDEIAHETRRRHTLRERQEVPDAGLSLPNVLVTNVDIPPRRGYDSIYGYASVSQWRYGYDYGNERSQSTHDLPFEQDGSGLLTLEDYDDSTQRLGLRIRGKPRWNGVASLWTSTQDGTDSTETVMGTDEDLYLDRDADWNDVKVYGPSGRVLREGLDYTLTSDRISVLAESGYELGDTVSLTTWGADDDVTLGIPAWVLEAMEARRRYHLERVAHGDYGMEATGNLVSISVGPVEIRQGTASSSLIRSATALEMRPARSDYWRLLSQHGRTSAGVA